MRITIVQGPFLPVPPLQGGAVEKIWFALGKEFVRRGHYVTHVSRCHEILEPEEFIEGVHHVRVPGYDMSRSLIRMKLQDLLYSRRVLKVLPEADILVTNTFWLPLLAPKTRLGKIYVHFARYPKGQVRLYFNAARLQTVSHAVKDAICREAPALATRVNVIPNFVPISDEELVETERNRTILYVGRIHPEKGIDLLLDAFKLLLSTGLGGWKLRIVGPWQTKHGGGGQQYIDALRQKSSEFASCVEWVGPVFDLPTLHANYTQSSLFVYPSLAERGETFGLAPLEAMAGGCPPIVSSLGCFKDFVKIGMNGWTFDHRSVDRIANLANVLKRLVGETDTLKKAGKVAHRTAQEYTLSKVAGQFLADFEETVRA